MKIWVSGSLAYDIILDYPGKFADHIKLGKAHVLSLSFLVKSVKKSVGGTAGNIAYSLAMLGVKSEILGAVGKDGREIINKYSRLGVSVKGIKISKLPTAAAYIMTDNADNQIAGFHPGAMMEKATMPVVKNTDLAIITADNPENMVKLGRNYRQKKVRYIIDPGQTITALSKSQIQECVTGAMIVAANDYEISYVTKYVKPKSTIVKTLGPKGSEIIYPNGKKIKIGIAKAKAVDPTGAGDAYRAGLICGIIKGLELKRAAQLGATAAAFAVEKYGTQNHRFNYGIIMRRHNRNFKEKIQ